MTDGPPSVRRVRVGTKGWPAPVVRNWVEGVTWALEALQVLGRSSAALLHWGCSYWASLENPVLKFTITPLVCELPSKKQLTEAHPCGRQKHSRCFSLQIALCSLCCPQADLPHGRPRLA